MKANETLIVHATDEGAVVVEPKSGTLHVLNTSATAILRAMMDGADPVAGLEREFEVSREQAQQATDRFLSAAQQRDLVRV